MKQKSLLDKIKKVRMSDINNEELFLFPKNFYLLDEVNRISTIKTLSIFANKVAAELDGVSVGNISFTMNVDDMMSYLYANQSPKDIITEKDLQSMITNDYAILFSDKNFIEKIMTENYANTYRDFLHNFKIDSDNVSSDFKIAMTNMEKDNFLFVASKIIDKTENIVDLLELVGLTEKTDEYFKLLLDNGILEVEDFNDKAIIKRNIGHQSVVELLENYFLSSPVKTARWLSSWTSQGFNTNVIDLIVSFSPSFIKEMDSLIEHKNAMCKILFKGLSKVLRPDHIKNAFKPSSNKGDMGLNTDFLISPSSGNAVQTSKILNMYRKLSGSKKIDSLLDVMEYMINTSQQAVFGGDYEGSGHTPYILMIVGMFEINSFKIMTSPQKDIYKDLFVKMLNTMSYIELDLMFNIGRVGHTKYGISIESAIAEGFKLNGIDYYNNKVLLDTKQSNMMLNRVLESIAINKWMTDSSASDFYSGLTKTFNLNISKVPKKILNQVNSKKKPLIKFRALLEKNILESEIRLINKNPSLSVEKLKL